MIRLALAAAVFAGSLAAALPAPMVPGSGGPMSPVAATSVSSGGGGGGAPTVVIAAGSTGVLTAGSLY